MKFEQLSEFCVEDETTGREIACAETGEKKARQVQKNEQKKITVLYDEVVRMNDVRIKNHDKARLQYRT